MKLVTYYFAVFFLCIVMTLPASAAGTCSYAKSVRQGRTEFDISSHPANGCAVQIVTVAVRRGGKKISVMKMDVDYLATSAKAVDLNGDGSPELVITSRTTEGVATEVLDVYWLDGSTLRRSKIPELADKGGYRGGDRFHLEGRRIVRNIPVYRSDDPIGKPSGGTRSLTYDFKDGDFALTVPGEKTTGSSDDSTVQSAAPAESVTPAETKPAVPALDGLVVTEIRAGESGIEIRANGVMKYTAMKLEKPQRLAIDIRGADSALAEKKIVINRYGISTVRVGHRKGSLRIVLDTTLRTFPKNVVKPSDGGILIEFTQ